MQPDRNDLEWSITNPEMPFKLFVLWTIKMAGASLIIYGFAALCFGVFWLFVLAMGFAATHH